jgi:hypothetical protein
MKLDKFFYDFLVELSDVEIQKKLWLNINNNTEHISSFDELYCSLFDDMDFDIEIQKIQNQDLENKLILLKNKLINYSVLSKSRNLQNDSIIIKDPKWIEICSFTKEIIISLNSM